MDTDMMSALETLSWIAGIVAVPVAVAGWFVGSRGKAIRSQASGNGVATAGDIHARGAGVVAGHHSPITINMASAQDEQHADRYKRRYEALQSARLLIGEMTGHHMASGATLGSFVRHAEDAPFVFGGDIVPYMAKIRDHALRVQSIAMVMEELPVGPDKAAAAREMRKHRQWLMEQRDVCQRKVEMSPDLAK